MLVNIINQRTATKNVLWPLFMLDGSMVSVWKSDLTKDTLITPRPRHFIASRDHSLVEGTVPKGSSKSMQGKELFACSSGLSTYSRTRNGKSEEHITVRNSYKNGNDPCSKMDII